MVTQNTRQYLNDRKYIYLIEFKPFLLKGGEAKAKLKTEGGLIIDSFKKIYPGYQIQANHKLDSDWISTTLAEYGQVGSILEYVYTSELSDLPSRSMTNEEAKELEGEVRSKIKVSDFIWIGLFGAAGLFCLKSYFSDSSLTNLVGSIIFLGLFLLFLLSLLNAQKEGSKLEFSRDDWIVFDTICCNTWFIETEHTEFAIDDPNRKESTCYCEVAAGSFALDRIFEELKQIGEEKKIFYNRKTGEIR